MNLLPLQRWNNAEHPEHGPHHYYASVPIGITPFIHPGQQRYITGGQKRTGEGRLGPPDCLRLPPPSHTRQCIGTYRRPLGVAAGIPGVFTEHVRAARRARGHPSDLICGGPAAVGGRAMAEAGAEGLIELWCQGNLGF